MSQKSLPRVAVLFNAGGLVCVIADRPCDVFTVDLTLEQDRVYRLSHALIIDAQQVDSLLAGEAVGHFDDGRDELLLEAGGRRDAN